MSTFHAEVRRDCAPWDGDAFSVSISTVADVKKIEPPYIHVSVWQTPDLKSGGRFAFPDASRRIGAAFIQPSSGSVIPLRGTVSFTSVILGEPVEGQFYLLDPGSKRYLGRFSANWASITTSCGETPFRRIGGVPFDALLLDAAWPPRSPRSGSE